MEKFNIKTILQDLGIKPSNPGVSTGSKWIKSSGPVLASYSPVDGKLIASVQSADEKSFSIVVKASGEAFLQWRLVPAPKRGEIVRQIGDALRKSKKSLGMLVSYEMGKSYQEGLGEVQEMIDICDFAVGLSRQLHGLTMHSERPQHRMYEQYHPLGIVNFFVDDKPSCCGATLSSGSYCAEKRPVYSNVKIGVGCNDDGIIAAKFEQGSAESLAHSFAHHLSHPDGTGGRHQRNFFAGRKPLTHFVVTVH